MIRGDVQGVGFRYFIRRRARELGLRGWVRNNDDGTVELLAEGEKPQLEQLRMAAEEGPRPARVRRVDAHWSAAAGGLDDFELTG